MYKTTIAPIIAVIALAIQAVFGIEIDKDLQEEIVVIIGNIILVGLAIKGVIDNHKKETKETKE